MAVRETKKTTVRMLSCTKHPIETIYVEWLQSRTPSSEPVPSPADVALRRSQIELRRIRREKMTDGQRRHRDTVAAGKDLCTCSTCEACRMEGTDKAFEADVMKTFWDVVNMKIPVAETIDFVFLLEHASIALREQIVRHRIGHRFGARLGADIIPDLAESTFWSQTTRVMNMGTFATEGEYLVPESADQRLMPGQEKFANPKTLEAFYHEQFNWAQSAYNKLVEAGMPVEDARNILPLGVQHRLTWKLNLSSLLHVLSKRGCWIAQMGMWEPVLMGIVDELARCVHPGFRRIIDPPCFKDIETVRATEGAPVQENHSVFHGCVFKLENENRVNGKDPYAPCPLYMYHHSEDSLLKASHRSEITVRGERYSKFWGRDVRTGQLLSQKGGVA